MRGQGLGLYEKTLNAAFLAAYGVRSKDETLRSKEVVWLWKFSVVPLTVNLEILA